MSSLWQPVKDANATAYALFRRHYSFNVKRDQLGFWPRHNGDQFVGPGEKLVLLTADEKSLFVWRKFRSMDNQPGVNCAVFRNESTYLASELIRAADEIAWERWPGERLYTYVNPRRVRSANPGYCFLMAGWNRCGFTKARRLLILEILPKSDPLLRADASTREDGEAQAK